MLDKLSDRYIPADAAMREFGEKFLRGRGGVAYDHAQ